MRYLAICLGCSCLVILASCGGKQADGEPPLRPVRAIRVGDASELIGRWYPGRAEATQEIDLAFEVEGRLIERPVKVGDEVAVDQVLARLDPRDYQNDLDAARAQLEQADAYRERIEQAAKTGAVSQQEVTDAVARQEVATANLAIKQKALDDTQVTAPFPGKIAATYVENYQNVRRKERVLRLLDISRVEMRIAVPEQFISYAAQVADIKCRFDAFPEREVPAHIKELGTEASETTRTYPVTLIMDQPDGFVILPGMTGEATATRLDQASEGNVAPTVPPAAVFVGEDGNSYVWVVDDSAMTVRRRAVELGALTSVGLQVKGPERGEWIVTAGVHYLEEGQRVRILDRARR